MAFQIAWDWMKENTAKRESYIYQDKALQPTNFTILPARYSFAKPTCDHSLGKNIDATGTWTQVDDGSTHLAPDFWGLGFKHTKCQNKFYHLEATKSCLAGKRIRVLGDSNARRLVKTLSSENQWCSGKTDLCQSEDWKEPEFMGYQAADVFGRRCTNAPIKVLDNTTIVLGLVGGLSTTPACKLFDELDLVYKRRVGEWTPALTVEEDFDVIVS